MKKIRSAVAGLLALAALAPARAEDLQSFRIVLQPKGFAPAELHVPSAKPFFLDIENGGSQPFEFEMASPPLEKVVEPGAVGRVRVRPLAKGRFEFFNDFHPETRGAIVAE